MIATALVPNSGSRSFIQVLKTVQANLVTLENDADGALAGPAQAKLGMGGHVLRQVAYTGSREAAPLWPQVTPSR